MVYGLSEGVKLINTKKKGEERARGYNPHYSNACGTLDFSAGPAAAASGRFGISRKLSLSW